MYWPRCPSLPRTLYYAVFFSLPKGNDRQLLAQPLPDPEIGAAGGGGPLPGIFSRYSLVLFPSAVHARRVYLRLQRGLQGALADGR